jgi:hypothetical protein
VNQASHAIREQNVHLPRFDNRRDLAFTKVRMQHCLPAAIRAGAIVWRENLVRSPARGAGFMGDPGVADGTAYPADSSCLGNRGDNVTTLFTTGDAHLFDSISDVENFLLFHNAPY